MTFNAEGLQDEKGRQIRVVLGNTAKDGSGTAYVPLLDDDGKTIISPISGAPFSVIDTQVIDGSLGIYAAGDVVGADDCCTTLAVMWEWDVARENGGYVLITNLVLTNETPNIAAQYDLLLSNSNVTSAELRDNFPSDFPLVGDRDKNLGVIGFPYSVARGATVLTTTEASLSTAGSNLPKLVKCAAGTTKIYGILVTRTAYTQVATDDLTIVMSGEQY